MSSIVAIVGRPNVGKSTFFNRLIEDRQAIVDETAGVTRDRHYGKADWNGVEFSVIDTGGYVIGSDDVFEIEIRKQVELAIDEADVILFMVDVKDGLSGMDQDVANLLRRSNKKYFLVANKVDNTQRTYDTSEFYQLGLGEVFGISAINGSGTGELLDEVVKHLKPHTDDTTEDLPKFAVVGRPNVGKSSLINTLIGNERNIVTPVAGTTRDSIYTRYNSFGFDFYLVDTAGLRKKGKVYEDIEFYSVLRSVRAIENSDVCILMLDAKEGFEGQDINIFRLAQRNHKGVIVVVNKWDLVEKDSNTHLKYSELIKRKLEPFSDVPIVFTSVTEKQRVFKALELAHKVYNNRKRKVSTSKLNEFLQPVLEKNPPPSVKGRYIKIKYANQLPIAYPAFAFFCNFPQYVREPYKRYLENRLRESFDFSGVPIEIFFRQK